MKTLTIRLTDEQSNMIANYMAQHDFKTASGALLDALQRAWVDQITISHLEDTISKQQSILDGFSSARDAFRSALTYLDQKSLL